MAEIYPINIWINEDRLKRLQQAGLADMTQEVFVGLKKLAVPANEKQKEVILTKFPMAKVDSATTKSIELLPRHVKDKIFDLVVTNKTLDVLDKFLA